MQLARWYRVPQTRRSNVDDEFRIYTRSEHFEGRTKGIGKSKLDIYKDEIIALLNNGSSKVFVAKRYKTSVGNLYHWLLNNKYPVKDDR